MAAAPEQVANTNTNGVAQVNPQQVGSSLHTVPLDSTAQLHNGDQVASIHLNNANEAYDMGDQEQMDVEREDHNNNNHATLLNGVMEAPHEQSTADQANGNSGVAGAGDTDMADTA